MQLKKNSTRAMGSKHTKDTTGAKDTCIMRS